MQGELEWLPLSQMQCHSCTITHNTIHWMSVMLLWLFQDTQGFVDVHVFFVDITLMILCEANIMLMWCLLLFFIFFPPRPGKPSAAYSSRLTSDILTSTSGFFYMYIELCFMYFNCVLVVEIFYCLFLGFCCLWRFFFSFLTLKTTKKKKKKTEPDQLLQC